MNPKEIFPEINKLALMGGGGWGDYKFLGINKAKLSNTYFKPALDSFWL